MKIRIRLMTSEKPTENGFPIYVIAQHKYRRKKMVIGHSLPEHWDETTQKPLSSHPAFYEFMPVVLDFHSKINQVNLKKLDFSSAVTLVFDSAINLGVEFKNKALKLKTSARNSDLYKTVVNSFSSFYPGVSITEITPEMAKKYMSCLLEKQRPNGVHTYMRTLNAIFNKLSNEPNPFSGIRPKKEKTQSKGLTSQDVKKIATTLTYVRNGDHVNTVDSINKYRRYWLLMFYLGGIDMLDLARLRYDMHVVNGRLEFRRGKGGTNAFVSNIILPEAWEILNQFDCKPYLVPINELTDYRAFVGNFNKRFTEIVEDLELTRRPLTKSARYTFINCARLLGIDRRITMEIVGHESKDTHNIYEENYPAKVRDEAHRKIISLQQL